MTDLCNETWIRRRSWPEPGATARALRVADLFCGCGGLTLGAFEACRGAGRKLEVAVAVDFDPWAIGVYRANFQVPESVAQQVDLTAVLGGRLGTPRTTEEAKFAKSAGRVDLLLAGPPCQGHSDLNNSSRRLDPRNSLYLRVVRAAEILRPRVVLIENVPSVVHDRGHVVSRAKNGLEGLGYAVSESMVRAESIGLPQTRKRHVVVAVRQRSFDFGCLARHKPEVPRSVRDFIGDLVGLNGASHPLLDVASRMSPANAARASYLYDNDKYDLPNELRPKCHRDVKHSYVSMYGRLNWDEPAQTITSGFGSMGQGRFLHPSEQRTITPHEAARLQGFPDFFSFDSIPFRNALQTTIGNAVPPKLSAIVISELISMEML